ncbi:DNA-directed RNA polymerases I, II, and III subunit RPABC3 [Malassezia furfur]|uniref:DNA-directed RNA polymerases I, II, and III subunit RPABC3 n=1 Tax=Malassezia furfur TaxID=55194 RepID=A0ABY8ERX8_MALFU|nr:DNA-directed RNA polymerases I, II, and III subunit RPABC3 [Malassezia furfur]
MQQLGVRRAQLRLEALHLALRLGVQAPQYLARVRKAPAVLQALQRKPLCLDVRRALPQDRQQLALAAVPHRMHNGEGELALGQVLTEPLVRLQRRILQVRVVVADLEEQPNQVDERHEVGRRRAAPCAHELDRDAKQTARLVDDHLDVLFLGGAHEILTPVQVHALPTVQAYQLLDHHRMHFGRRLGQCAEHLEVDVVGRIQRLRYAIDRMCRRRAATQRRVILDVVHQQTGRVQAAHHVCHARKRVWCERQPDAERVDELRADLLARVLIQVAVRLEHLTLLCIRPCAVPTQTLQHRVAPRCVVRCPVRAACSAALLHGAKITWLSFDDEMSHSLFDTQFVVQQIDPDGKKFDRVSRIIASSSMLDMTLSIDIATDIYPIHVGQQLTFQLVSSLRREKGDGEEVQADRDAWRGDGGDDLSADFDYVMYGKIFKYDERSTEQVTVYGSFGGLLMALTGSYRHLSKITVGTNVYLLIR